MPPSVRSPYFTLSTIYLARALIFGRPIGTKEYITGYFLKNKIGLIYESYVPIQGWHLRHKHIVVGSGGPGVIILHKLTFLVLFSV